MGEQSNAKMYRWNTEHRETKQQRIYRCSTQWAHVMSAVESSVLFWVCTVLYFNDLFIYLFYFINYVALLYIAWAWHIPIKFSCLFFESHIKVPNFPVLYFLPLRIRVVSQWHSFVLAIKRWWPPYVTRQVHDASSVVATLLISDMHEWR